MKRRKANYKFTSKKHPVRAIASTILGFIAVVTYVIAMVISTKQRGEVEPQMGIPTLLGFLYACVGLYFGIASRFEKEKFYLFCYIGMVLNTIAVAMSIFTIYLGVRG